jgi:cytochrome c oxidase cbb3-type subunit 3/ubiquinol-cytochrome c reductase cytochrome c subunit
MSPHTNSKSTHPKPGRPILSSLIAKGGTYTAKAAWLSLIRAQLASNVLLLLAAALAILLTGCNLPGRPKPGPEVPRPDAVLGFEPLYSSNCAGCHGAGGQNGPATDLANPLYQAFIDDASLKDIIANGEKGTLMPAFSIAKGGNLTDAQIAALIYGMRQRWSKPASLAGATLPPYHAAQPGDLASGQAVYAAACARCHGATPQQPGPAGSILDGSFLALINLQTIRTTIVAGRPDIGQPDWRSLIPGRPMTETEIENVSAWLIAQTPATPGHPYPNTQPTTAPAAEAKH